MDTSGIRPKFAAQLQNWRLTLLDRFEFVLRRISRELDENVYHAPGHVEVLVSNFIGEVQVSDCIARSDELTFGRYLNALEVEIRKLRYLERPSRAA